jgi:hypothetical protein
MAEISRPLSEQVVYWLETFSPKVQSQIIAEAATDVSLRIQEMVGASYPPDPPNQADWRGKMIRTEKQKRWWWAMMNKLARGEVVPDALHGWRAAYRQVKGHKVLVISGHYKRTGTLVRSIGTHSETDKSGTSIEVGPGLAAEMDKREVEAYSRYVIDLPPSQGGQQAAIHQNRWLPLFTLLETSQDELFDLFARSLIAGIDKRNKHLRPAEGSIG